jgi:DnaK suppressor protein
MNNLDQVKQELEARKQELELRVTAINADVSHLNQPLSNDWSEQAVERENDEVLEALGNSSQDELRQIHLALQRIEAGRYETCEQCEQVILAKRLQLLPHSIYCTACAEKLESTSN